MLLKFLMLKFDFELALLIVISSLKYFLLSLLDSLFKLIFPLKIFKLLAVVLDILLSFEYALK